MRLVNKAIKSLKDKWVLHPYLVNIYFILYYLSFLKFNLPRFQEIFLILITLNLISFIFLYLIRKFPVKYQFKLSNMVTIFLIFFYFYNDLVSNIQIILPWFGGRYLFLILLIVFGSILKSNHLVVHVNFYLNSLLIILLMLSLTNILMDNIYGSKSQGSIKNHEKSSISPPDIFLIVLDGYSSHKNLKKYWNKDNDDFVSKLDSLGFYNYDRTNSNYVSTIQTIPTLLNLNYIDKQNEQNGVINIYDIHKNRVVNFLKENKYQYNNLSIFTSNTDTLFDKTNQLPILKISSFEDILINKSYFSFFQKLKIKKWTALDLYKYNKMGYENILFFLKSKSHQPQFTYYHCMLPHFPYFLNKNGNFSNEVVLRNPQNDVKKVDAWFNNLQNSNEKSTKVEFFREKKLDSLWNIDYVNHIFHTNKQILTVINKVLKKNKNTTIIVISDHGFRFLSPSTLAERREEAYSNICHIYFPDKNYKDMPNKISPVNIFRIILNKYFHTKLVIVPNDKI